MENSSKKLSIATISLIFPLLSILLAVPKMLVFRRIDPGVLGDAAIAIVSVAAISIVWSRLEVSNFTSIEIRIIKRWLGLWSLLIHLWSLQPLFVTPSYLGIRTISSRMVLDAFFSLVIQLCSFNYAFRKGTYALIEWLIHKSSPEGRDDKAASIVSLVRPPILLFSAVPVICLAYMVFLQFQGELSSLNTETPLYIDSNIDPSICSESDWFDLPGFRSSPEGADYYLYHSLGGEQISFSADETSIYTASVFSGVVEWDLNAQTYQMIVWSKFLQNFTFSPDGSTLAFEHEDRIAVVDLATRELILTLHNEIHRVAMGLSEDGSLLATVSVSSATNNSIKIWDVASGRELTSFPPILDSLVTQLTFSPDGSKLAIATMGGGIYLWEFFRGPVHTHIPAYALISDIAFSPDNQALALAINNGPIILWDTSTGDRGMYIEPATDPRALIYTPNGKHLVAALRDGRIILYDAYSGDEAEVLSDRGPSVIEADLEFSPNGSHLAFSSSSTIEVRAFDEGKLEFDN